MCSLKGPYGNQLNETSGHGSFSFFIGIENTKNTIQYLGFTRHCTPTKVGIEGYSLELLIFTYLCLSVAPEEAPNMAKSAY